MRMKRLACERYQDANQAGDKQIKQHDIKASAVLNMKIKIQTIELGTGNTSNVKQAPLIKALTTPMHHLTRKQTECMFSFDQVGHTEALPSFFYNFPGTAPLDANSLGQALSNQFEHIDALEPLFYSRTLRTKVSLVGSASNSKEKWRGRLAGNGEASGP